MRKILALDDDNLMTEFYAALFSGAGYDVRTAPDAAAGIDVYYDFKPDLIVLDADMPSGGGEKVFNLARMVLGSGIPVVFVTGLPERVAAFALTQVKVRIFEKPVKSGELLAAVSEMLKIKASI